MKKYFTQTVLLLFAVVLALSVNAKNKKWELGCQAYSFKENTLEETLQSLQTLNIKYVELFKKQSMDATDDRVIDYKMPEDQVQKMKSMFKKYNVEPLSYGVITVRTEKDWIALFQFAKKVGIKTIVSEASPEQLPMVDELCKKYKIQIALHNHAKPKHYWNPEMAKKALQGRSKYMGVCPDVGHWRRSGIDVAAGLKMLKGRIVEIHIKDVTTGDISGKTIVLGEGVINWNHVFAELKRQDFKGKFILEHDVSWDNPVPDMQKNIAFFESKTDKLK